MLPPNLDKCLPKAAKRRPMSIVTLGDSLGSSLGSPEPPFCLVGSLLSSPDRILNMSSARWEAACCNFSIFFTPKTKRLLKPIYRFLLGLVWTHNLQLGLVFGIVLHSNLEFFSSPRQPIAPRRQPGNALRSLRETQDYVKDLQKMTKSCWREPQEISESSLAAPRCFSKFSGWGWHLFRNPQDSQIMSSAAPMHVNLIQSWNPGSSNPPSLGRRNARSDWTWPRGGTESALLNLLSKCLYLLPS